MRAQSPHLDVPFMLSLQCLTFLPIQSFSDRAAELIEKQRSRVERNAEKYPLGLLDQYRKQLEHLADKDLPDAEFLLFPFAPGNRKMPEPSKPFINVSVALTHPWSRGSIVRMRTPF